MGSKLFHRFSIALAVLGAGVPSLRAFAQDPAETTPSRELDPARIVSAQVESLARQLSLPSADQDSRDMAARRLIDIGTAEARNVILFSLKDPGNTGGRLAAARAVAEDLPPDPQFVDSLFVLLDVSQPRSVIDAATTALGNYKISPDVNARLVLLTSATTPDAIRFAAIRALGHHHEKQGAKRLVELSEEANPPVAAAAGEALQMLSSTQLSLGGDWAKWWASRAEMTAEQFRTEMSAARNSYLEQRDRRTDDAIQELRRSVMASITGATKEQLGAVLNQLLTSPRETVRVIAIGQAYELASTGDLPIASLPVVRAMLSDPRREIRLQAARTVSRVNDLGAFDPITQQVAVESDPGVRAELANALGVIGNLDAVALLKPLLDDSSASVVNAAAGALAKLGPELVLKDPKAATDLGYRIRAMLDAKAKGPSTSREREALIAALVPLKQTSMSKVYVELLTADPRESDRIRRLAAAGLGAIGDPNWAGTLSDVMSDTLDGSPAMRLEAVNALGKTADAFFYADALYKRMDPKNEPDPNVREAAWRVITKLFDIASRNQLGAWPDKPLIKGDAAKELLIFQSLAAKAQAANDQDEYVLRLEQIADTELRLGDLAVQPERDQRYAEATTNFRKALDQTRATSGPSGRIERLIESTLKAMLRGRKYPEASAFASEILREPANQQYQVVVGPQFKLEAERLSQESGQLDDALSLIAQALLVEPALADNYSDPLRELKRSIESRRGQKNQLAVPDVIQALAMR